MNVQVIPLYSDKTPRWKMQVKLGGKKYALYFSWNTRMKGWALSILDADGTVLLGSIRLAPGCPLIGKYQASCPDLPPGCLMLVDREGNLETAEPDRRNLASRFFLAYIAEG